MTAIKRQRSTTFSTHALPQSHPWEPLTLERDRGGTGSAPWQSDGIRLNPALRLGPVSPALSTGAPGWVAAADMRARRNARSRLLHARNGPTPRRPLLLRAPPSRRRSDD